MHNIAMFDDLGFPPFLVIFSFQTRNSNLETRNQFGLRPVLYQQRAASTKINPTNPAIPPSLFAKICDENPTVSHPTTSRNHHPRNSHFDPPHKPRFLFASFAYFADDLFLWLSTTFYRLSPGPDCATAPTELETRNKKLGTCRQAQEIPIADFFLGSADWQSAVSQIGNLQAPSCRDVLPPPLNLQPHLLSTPRGGSSELTNSPPHGLLIPVTKALNTSEPPDIQYPLVPTFCGIV